MTRAMEDGCLLVVAPAGYGKTLAVQQAVEEHGGIAAWHACRERDADGGRLVVSILEAVRRTVPGAADVLLDELGVGGEAVDASTAAQALVDDLERLLVEPLVLVLDDVERLGDAAGAMAVLGALLDGAGGPLRLVIATRRRPRLKLAKLTAAGVVVELGETDLVFSSEECAAVLAARMGREPTDAEIEASMARTLGWPLGVALGAGRADAGGAASTESIEQFLVEEVLDALDAGARAALLSSSVVEELPASMLTALGLAPGALDAAARLGLSLRPVAGRPDASAWHPLVREALRSRWRRERPDAERAELLDRAATALAGEGRRAEAVEAWLEAGRGGQALGLMLGDAPTLVRASPDLLRTWLGRLGEDVRASAGAHMLDGLLLAADGRLGDAVDVLRDAAAELEAAGIQDAADAACAALLEAAYWSGRLEEADGVGVRYSQPEELGGRPVALLASAWTAILHAARGDAGRAVDLRDRILAQPGSVAGAQVARIADAYLLFPAGRHDEMLSHFRSVEHVLDRPEQVLYVLAISAFANVDVGRAQETLEFNDRLVAEVQRSGTHPFVGTLGPVLRGWTLAQVGRHREADEAVASLAGGVPPDTWAMAWVPATVAMTAAAQGDAQTARGAAELALTLVPRMPIMFADFLVCSLAPALAEIGDRARALEVLEEALTRVEGSLGREAAGYHVARLLVQRAWIRDQEGDATAAERDVVTALELTGGAPAAHLVRAEWPRLRGLLWELLARDVLPAATVVGAVEGAFGEGPELLDLAAHPSAAVRAAVAPAVAGSGHPDAAAALKALAGDTEPGVAAAAADAAERVRRRPPARMFTLLGGFGLRRGSWEVDERTWGRPTVVRLVRFLLVHRGAPVPEERILEALWPDRPADKARSALQVAVSRARQVLDPAGAAGSAIRYGDRAYLLELEDRDRVDSERFAAVATDALATVGLPRRGALEAAAGLWTGTPLPEEEYADWVVVWREGLEALLHHVLVALAEEHRAAGDELAVAAVARRLVALDPLDEGAHRMLITAHARTGRRSLALRQYLECRRLLVEGMGLEPDADTTGLQRRVLAGLAV
jgi:ATP/maltotriose-dependent transcriptional regulator MalT/DNA-binding SARP family transcriptional activator